MIANIRGVDFPIIEYDDAIALFEQWVQGGISHQVFVANVHTLITALHDPEYRRIMDDADLITMDGQPLRWYVNLIYGAGLKERVCGPELMRRCLEFGLDKGWRHYFLGGRAEVLELLVATLARQFPGLQVAGKHSPPFRVLTAQEEAVIVDSINSAKPHFLWVGLGAPKQEQWIYRHLTGTRVPVQLGVGAAFDFHAGTVKRAPTLMQRMGLEWLYRAWKDRRLWRRYAATNPEFLKIFISDWFARHALRRAQNSRMPIRRN